MPDTTPTGENERILKALFGVEAWKMDIFIHRELLGRPLDMFGRARNWTGSRAKNDSERDAANGRAIRLCEIICDRRGWYVDTDRADEAPFDEVGPPKWTVSFSKWYDAEKVQRTLGTAQHPSFPAAVCEAAWRAWHKEQGNV